MDNILSCICTMEKSGGVQGAKSCRNIYSINNRTVRFFRFPNPIHKIQIDKWKLACNDDFIMIIMMTDNVKLHYIMRICSLHFEEIKGHRLEEDAVPILNLEVSTVTSPYEEHSYIRDENLEVGECIDIDDCSVSDYRMDIISRSIGTQTEGNTVNVGTQTSVDTSDCQIQTDMGLSAKTPRKLKPVEKLKDQKANIKITEKEKARKKTRNQVTIRAVLGLWNDFKKEGVKDLRTLRLNQYCLENFFEKVRQQQGNSVNRTVVQFSGAFKKST